MDKVRDFHYSILINLMVSDQPLLDIWTSTLWYVDLEWCSLLYSFNSTFSGYRSRQVKNLIVFLLSFFILLMITDYIYLDMYSNWNLVMHIFDVGTPSLKIVPSLKFDFEGVFWSAILVKKLLKMINSWVPIFIMIG